MAPIRVPHSNSLIHSSAHAPHRVGIGARADSGASSGNNNNNSSAVSPPLVVVVVAIGLFSLTMFSMFGRRLLELGGRSSAAAGDTPSRYPAAQTSVQDDRRLFLSQALGLGHTGRLHREPSPARLGAKPKLWDIHIDNQIHAEPRRGQHASLSWDGIMPIAVTVSEEERCPVADPAPHALTRRPTDRRLCRLFRWLCLSCRRRRPTQTGQAVRDEQPSAVDRKSTASLLPPKNLQVVVAIVMPCRPRQAVYPFDMDSRRTHGVDVDYSIGLYTCSWQRETM